ncbi:MAG: hypothetical protein LBG80_17110 [Bacteroidales bacterium]|jgi:hypothetical protein|nr:hypothetical protein [Bacteroidales bacterium]
MKKILFITLFLATLADGTNAQNNTNTKLNRTLLFTLSANEEILLGEYFVFQKLNQNRFACIIYDTLNNTYTFVFNGKRIAQDKWRPFVHYLNVNEENGYVVEYTWQEKNYANIKGKVYVPFDGELYFAEDNEGNEIYDRFYYRKKEGENINYYVHYSGTIDGPFDKVKFPDETAAAAGCEYLYLLADQWYEHYKNDKNKLSQQSFRYSENGKWYVNINGNPSRGYDEVYYLHFTESGKYIYRYRENGKEYVNINGSPSRGYDYVFSLHLTESGKYAYCYKENGKYYVNINGDGISKYDNVHDLQLTEGGKYAYSYVENGNLYVSINGKASRVCYNYDNDNEEHDAYYAYNNIQLTESGFSFYFDKGTGKLFQNENGKEKETPYIEGGEAYWGLFYGHYNNSPYNFSSTNQAHEFYSICEYEYVVIDGKCYGKAPAIRAWYDKEKNAFIWNAVEGKELVVYEYKLN